MDVYDLILFAILRITSLKDMGFAGEQLVNHGILLLNLQMIGMLVGGIFFGKFFGDMGAPVLMDEASNRLPPDVCKSCGRIFYRTTAAANSAPARPSSNPSGVFFH